MIVIKERSMSLIIRSRETGEVKQKGMCLI